MPSPFIRPGVLSDLRRITADALPDVGVVARTGATLPLRIQEMIRQVSLAGLVGYPHVPHWSLFFAVGADGTLPDVRLADAVSVTGKGTYVVTEVSEPRSYAASYLVQSLQTARADGSVPLYTNQSVSFRRKGDDADQLTGVPVFIFSTSKDIMPAGDAPSYEWGIVFPSSLAFPSGAKIASSDRIAWPRFGTNELGVAYDRPLKTQPRPHDSPLPVSVAYFNESAS